MFLSNHYESSLFTDEDAQFSSLIESLIGGSALGSVIYVSVCFIVKKGKIKDLVERLTVFEQYLPEKEIQAAEKSAKFYTKSFIIYGIIGNSLYDILPFFTAKECDRHRTQHMLNFGIACKVIVRYVLPFKYDCSPYYEMVIMEQILVAILGRLEAIIFFLY